MNIKNLLETNPVIAAVKDEKQLNIALKSDCEIIFVLYGDIITINSISDKICASNKCGIIHVDLVEGFSNKEVVIKYVKEKTGFSGIISTKPQMIKCAKNYDLFAIQRVFVYDSISLANVKKHMANNCDAVEVLPGIMPKVIKVVCNYSSKPIIAGGLISLKEEVMEALSSGAACVSTTKEEIWKM